MLTNAEIAVIHALHDGREATVRELVEETGHSTAQVYRVADGLLDTGLLAESRGHHNQRILRVTDHPVIEAYRTLTSKRGHVDWGNLLSSATMRVAWYLDEPRRVRTIADRLGLTRQAVHHALSPLKNRAMLSPSGPEYALTPDLQPVLEFVRTVVTHEHRTRVRRLAPSATVVWCDPKRALVHAHAADDTAALQDAGEGEMTGLARFEEFGLQFFLADEPAFWYAPETEPTPAQIVCHSLVPETDSRRVSYALLFIEHAQIDEETLLNAATWYGIASTVSEMYRFIEHETQTNSGETALPNPSEYEALKSQYGVA